MAEDERLDLMYRNSGRWRELQKLLARREPPERVLDKAVYCLRKTLSNLVGRLRLPLPIAELLEAAVAGSHDDVHAIVRRCKQGREYAQLFELEAGRGLGAKAVLVNVCGSILDRFLDQIGMEEAASGRARDFSAVGDSFSELKASMRDPIDRIASEIVEDPSRPLRMLPVAREARLEEQKALLSTSLMRP